MSNVYPIFLLMVLVSCSKGSETHKTRAHQYVEVESVHKTQSNIVGKFTGHASRVGTHDFIVKTVLPLSIVKETRIGDEIFISLPLVNSSLQLSKVSKISGNIVSLSLKNQIHDLSDQELEIQVPLHNASLYEIPFSSIYSPMGGDTFVFVVESNSAIKKPVDVVQVVGNDKILVLAQGLNSKDKIVSRGLDNLVEGDRVLSEDLHEF